MENQQNFENQEYTQTAPRPYVESRNIAICIILSLLTCGLYQIYWLIKVNGEINALAGEPHATDGVLVVIFSIITCGIYGIYWNYKMGCRVDRINDLPGGNTGLMYLLLAFFGLGIVNMALMQDLINQHA